MGVVMQTYIGVETGSRVSVETYVRVLEAMLSGGYAHLPAALITGPIVREGGVAYALPPTGPVEGVHVERCDDLKGLVCAVQRQYEAHDLVVRFSRTGPQLVPDWVDDEDDDPEAMHCERGIGLFSLLEPTELRAVNAYAETDDEDGDLYAGTVTLFVELEGKDAPMSEDVLDSGLPDELEALTSGTARVAGGAW